MIHQQGQRARQVCGGTLRVWNDGIADISRIPVDKDVIIEYWGKGETSKKDANRGPPVGRPRRCRLHRRQRLLRLYYYRDQPSSYVMQAGLEGYGKWTRMFYQNDGYIGAAHPRRQGLHLAGRPRQGHRPRDRSPGSLEGLRYGADVLERTPKADGTLRLSRRALRPASPPPTSTYATISPPASTPSHCPTDQPERVWCYPTAGTASDTGSWPPPMATTRSARSTRTAASPSTWRKRLTRDHVSTTPDTPRSPTRALT